MTSVTLPNTSKGTSDPNLFSDVYNNDNAITTVVNGNIDNTNIASGAGVALNKLASGSSAQLIVCNGSGVPTYVAATGDVTIANTGVTAIGATKVTNAMLAGSIANSKLASSGLGHVKPIHEATTMVLHDQVAGTLFLCTGQYAEASPYSILNTTLTADGGGVVLPTIRLNAVEYAVTSMTTALSLRSQVITNATAPGINFTFGLFPITVAGIADTLTITAGTVVTGSNATAHTTPGASAISTVSDEFDFPSTDTYALACVTSGTLANNSAVMINAQLRVRHT